tara:strand:- start:75 stop:275 length:201 start_codon:yes stop_codon:yes gene_type:complete
VIILKWCALCVLAFSRDGWPLSFFVIILKKSVFYCIDGERFAQEEIAKNLSLIGFMIVLMSPWLRP